MTIRVTPIGDEWLRANRRRCALIRKDVNGSLNANERAELASLEALTDERIAVLDERHPPQTDEIERTVERLKQEGRWPSE